MPRIGTAFAFLATCFVAGSSIFGDEPKPIDVKREGEKSFAEASKDLKQLALAMHLYEKKHGRLPPAAIHDKNGKPTVSWRVLILPYLKEETLYKKFTLDEAWDSSNNKKLIANMPAIFRGPNKKLNDEGKTVYLAPIGKNTVFPPNGEKVGLKDLYDGTSNTILLIEVNDDCATVWTKPDDLPLDLNKPMKSVKGLVRPGQEFFLAVMCDGWNMRFKNCKNPDELANLSRVFTHNDGEVIDYSAIIWEPDPK